MGWRPNQHTAFTKSLSSKKIRFYAVGKPPKDTGGIGFMLLAKNIKHQHAERIPSAILYNIALETKEVVKILEPCKDLLVPQGHTPDANAEEESPEEEPAAVVSQPKDLDYDVYEFLTDPQPRRNVTMSSPISNVNGVHSFTQAFYIEAAANRQRKGYVGRNILARLRREYDIKKTATQLIESGLLIGEVSENADRVGWYKPGPKMLAGNFSAEVTAKPPEDPYQYAQWVVKQEPHLLQQQAEIQQKLSDVALAKKAIEQLGALRPKT
ncbi:MAG: hypothetical protein AAB552_03255 [Patescibacteria group bacterium]